MDQETLDPTLPVAGLASPELSPWHLFVQSDLVVKVVIILLLFCSIWVWAIIFEKWVRLRRLSALAERFDKRFWSGVSLDELFERIGEKANHPLALVFVAAMREWRRSAKAGLRLSDERRTASMFQRIGRAMDLVIEREQRGLEKYLGFLATVGSTAPFVGLFGTVWGIMNSFTSIAVSKNTSIAVVAPGIAEALFATALGLVAAIPAVVAYNKLSIEISRYVERLDHFAIEFQAVISRQLEQAPAGSMAAIKEQVG